MGPLWKVYGKGLKREHNPARLAATDGELIAGRGGIDSPQRVVRVLFAAIIHPDSLEVYYVRSS
jgi:hypothetical protein